MDESHKKIIQHLESLELSEARNLIAAHHYGRPGSHNQSLCEAWLVAKEASAREAAEAEGLSISRKALRNSKWANVIAVVAVVLSAATAIVIAYVQSNASP